MPTAIQEFLFGFRDALLKQNSATQHKVQPAEFSCKKTQNNRTLKFGPKIGSVEQRFDENSQGKCYFFVNLKA